MASNPNSQVDKLYRDLIDEGMSLRQAYAQETDIQPKHIEIIRGWINQSIENIQPAMPPQSDEFAYLCEIREKYKNVIHVLPGNTFDHISDILECLKKAYNYFQIWLGFKSSDLSHKDRANACLLALSESYSFSKNHVIGLLKGQENGRTTKTALLHSYGRMYCWIQSMVKLGLDDASLIAEHTLALAGCLRAIFELFLDIELLVKQYIPDAVQRYFAFHKVQRLKIAKNSLQLHNQFNHLRGNQLAQFNTYADPTTEQEINDCVVTLWGRNSKGRPNKPRHWTGATVIDRVKKLNEIDIFRYYQHTYHYCNWSLHSGYFGFILETQECTPTRCQDRKLRDLR